MKHFKPIKPIWLAAMLLLLSNVPLTASAYVFMVDGIAYNKNSDGKTVTVTSGGNYSGDIVIPESVANNGIDYSVTSIGADAFSDCSGLTSITIPNSVTSIGGYAFSGCSGLTSVHITDLAAWCNIAFGSTDSNPLYFAQHLFLNGNEVKDLVIPNSVTSIGSYAFNSCSGLTSVTIPNSVTSIGTYAFGGCFGLTSMVVENGNSTYDSRNNCNAIIETATNTLISGCKNTVILNSVTSIGDGAFFDCSGLTSVTIPNSVTTIGGWAFCGCSGLTSVTIPNSVTSISFGAFYECTGLTSVTIPNSVTTIGQQAFYSCSGLTSVTIPNSVTTIGQLAFYSCSGLTSVTIGNSVTSISYGAFAVCSGLTSVDIPNSVTTIDQYAFWQCSGLTSVTIGNSVTSIGGYAFAGCSGLTTVNWNAKSCPDFSYKTAPFIDLTEITSFNFGNEVEHIPAYLCYKLSHLSSMTIGNSVTSIGNSAFYNCGGLTSVTIPNSVTSIGPSAFCGCSGLTSVIIGNSVTSIGNYAFYDCSGLTSITIPNSVTSIGERAFYIYGYPKGKTLTLCGGVENIGNDAFKSYRNGTNIATLILKDSVVNIKNLGADPNQIYSYATTPPECDENSFTHYNGTLHVPENSIVAYATADYWSNFANLVNDAVEPQSVSLSQSEAEIEPGNTLTLTATVTPSNATPNTVRWTTSNSEVATVATNGRVTAVGFGECDITATVADKTAVCHVTVREQQVVISLDNHELYVGVNKIAWLTPSMSPVSTDLAVESSNTGVAIAQMNSGRVRVIGVSPGVVTVTVSSVDGTAQPDSCVVTVEPDFYYLTITSGGHASVRQKVAPRGTYTYTLTPNDSEGRVKMVKFNGEDVMSQVSNGIYTTPAITENSTLEVTFE